MLRKFEIKKLALFGLFLFSITFITTHLRAQSNGVIRIFPNSKVEFKENVINGKKTKVLHNHAGKSTHSFGNLHNDSLLFSSPILVVESRGSGFELEVKNNKTTTIIVTQNKISYRINVPGIWKIEKVNHSKSFRTLDTFLQSKTQMAKAGTRIRIAATQVDKFYQAIGMDKILTVQENEKYKLLQEFDKDLDVKEFTKKLQVAYTKYIDINVEKTNQKKQKHSKVKRKILLTENYPISFLPGSASLSKNSRKSLDRIIKELKKYPNNKIRIAGYTDSEPIKKSGFLDNWNLAIARSMSVFEYLIKNSDIKKSNFSIGVGGYGKASNVRKVEIIILPSK